MEVCNGPIKPDIVFFGECLPKKFEWGWERISSPPYIFPNENQSPIPEDEGCDLMIIIGTSLAVPPFSNTIYKAKKDCPKVLINLENLAENGYDF